jgi:biotin carboxylase
MKKNILIIGDLRSAHRKLRDLDSRLTLLIERERLEYLPMSDADIAIYERILALPQASPIEDWIKLASFIHDQDPFHIIYGFHELNQHIAAAIASELQLDYHSPDAIDNTRNKAKMREKLREVGIDPTASRRIDSCDDVIDFAQIHGYPLIMKPVDGRASTGVSMIRSATDIPGAIEWLQRWSPASRMFIEKFLDGDEFSVEALSEKGQHRVICITKKYKEPIHFIEMGHCIPADLDVTVEKSIEILVKNALTALGICNGPTHTEVMLTADGPHIIETHPRLGGDCIPDLIKILSNVDLTELWTRQVLGEDVLALTPHSFSKDKFVAIWYSSPSAFGTVEQIVGLEQARTCPNVEQIEIEQGPGSTLDGVRDSFSRGAYAIATGHSPDEALSCSKRALDQIRFLISCPGQKELC